MIVDSEISVSEIEDKPIYREEESIMTTPPIWILIIYAIMGIRLLSACVSYLKRNKIAESIAILDDNKRELAINNHLRAIKLYKIASVILPICLILVWFINNNQNDQNLFYLLVFLIILFFDVIQKLLIWKSIIKLVKKK